MIILTVYPKFDVVMNDGTNEILSLQEAARTTGATLGSIAYECDGSTRTITNEERRELQMQQSAWNS